MEKNKIFKNVTIVSSTTTLSRILGYIRDMTFFAFFGISEIGSAFLLAFGFPNLFRKLLGEGALSSAIVPILSSHYVRHGKASMLKLFSHIFCRILIILVGILLASLGIIFLLHRYIADCKWRLALALTAILFPYMVLICLAAIISSALNVLGKFFITSVNQIWMNIAMITFMLCGGIFFKCTPKELVKYLITGVLLGGVLQLTIPMFALFFSGWRPAFDPTVPRLKKNLRDVWRLFLPGAFGAAIEQLNLIISRTIAFGFHSSAVSVLYIASRIVEFPVGIFSAAITTVFFPNIAKIISSHSSKEEINQVINSSLLAIIWILVPSSIGIFMLKSEILSLLFQRGNFLSTDVVQTIPVLSIYCVSMIFSGILNLFVKAFHAMKDTTTPMFIGFLVLVTNVTCAIFLMKIFAINGLAMATTIACVLQAVLLVVLLKRKLPTLSLAAEKHNYATTFRGCALVALTTYLIKFAFQKYCLFSEQTSNLLIILLSAFLSLLIYLVATKKLVFSVISSKKMK